MSNEAASADGVVAENFLGTPKTIIKEGSYFPKQIFNMDKTWLEENAYKILYFPRGKHSINIQSCQELP